MNPFKTEAELLEYLDRANRGWKQVVSTDPIEKAFFTDNDKGGMKMIIPKKLKIGGHIYDVIYPYHYTERGDRRGDHDPTQKWIRLDDKDSFSHEMRAESEIAVSFLHEILHACDSITGNEVFRDEKVCVGISEALFQILRDNKLVFTKDD